MVAFLIGIILIVSGAVAMILSVVESMSTTDTNTRLYVGGGVISLVLGIVLTVWG